MITAQNLKDLGFVEMFDIFTRKDVWTLGVEEVDFGDSVFKVPIIEYVIEKQTCKTIRGEFCTIAKVCKSCNEITKFVESINYLFNLSIDINSVKSINFEKIDKYFESEEGKENVEMFIKNNKQLFDDTKDNFDCKNVSLPTADEIYQIAKHYTDVKCDKIFFNDESELGLIRFRFLDGYQQAIKDLIDSNYNSDF